MLYKLLLSLLLFVLLYRIAEKELDIINKFNSSLQSNISELDVTIDASLIKLSNIESENR